jgi:putative ubiquitin-RnfH superfamily antitoxin RatB of RatAB toxin-antitoxin module
MAHAEDATLRVEVVYCPRSGAVDSTELMLPLGTTVGDALTRSGLAARHVGIRLDEMLVGVWGRRCSWEQALREGDRVELYRPLTVDPKEARRLRYRGQRSKARP